MEVKSLLKGEKMPSKFEPKTNMQKKRKKGPGIHSGIGFDGLAEAAGEVRRGKLSGYGGIPAKNPGRIPWEFKHAKHPGGVRRI